MRRLYSLTEYSASYKCVSIYNVSKLFIEFV